MIVLEGENPLYKSSPNIAGSSSQMVHLTPYSTSKNRLNNLSGDSFNTSGDSVTYAFDVKQAVKAQSFPFPLRFLLPQQLHRHLTLAVSLILVRHQLLLPALLQQNPHQALQ